MRIIYILFISLSVSAQDSSSIKIQHLDTTLTQKENSFGLRLLPSRKNNIYGISLGLIGSEVFCDISNTRKSHGFNIQLFGQGIFTLLNYS